MKKDKWGCQADYQQELADQANRHCEACKELVEPEDPLFECVVCGKMFSEVCCSNGIVPGVCINCP